MPTNDASLFEQYLATKRRIGETERRALKKVGAGGESGAKCSFCGRSQDRATMLIQGAEDAFYSAAQRGRSVAQKE